jgi:hypothetical protein
MRVVIKGENSWRRTIFRYRKEVILLWNMESISIIVCDFFILAYLERYSNLNIVLFLN